MRTAALLLFSVLLLMFAPARPAAAVLQFCNVFIREHINEHPDEEFAAEVRKPANRCFICHQGKPGEHHNVFGIHLVGMLDRREDIRNVEKISAAIKKVLAMRVDPDDEESETFADRLAASKWPGGELEDLKKDPEELAADR